MNMQFGWAAGIALALGAAGAAQAFGTINGLGQRNEHQRITRVALSSFAPKTLDLFAGTDGSFGAIGAPDRPGRGLTSLAAAHCDGGDHLAAAHLGEGAAPYPQSAEEAAEALLACARFIRAHLAEAVTLSAPLAAPDADNAALDCKFDGKSGSAKCRALGAFGVALHAAQDFYSHSNWTDRPEPGAVTAKNPPGLGMEGPAPFLDPRLTEAAVAGLISGCYEGFPESLFCEYGGFGPFGGTPRVKHAFLNKDKGPVGAHGPEGPGKTPRGAHSGNFERAVTAAIEDTADKWRWFEEEAARRYGEAAAARIVCAMKSDDPAEC